MTRAPRCAGPTARGLGARWGRTAVAATDVDSTLVVGDLTLDEDSHEVRRARVPLEHTNRPLGDIQRLVGYQDPGAFRSLFTRQVGLSPRADRAFFRRRATVSAPPPPGRPVDAEATPPRA